MDYYGNECKEDHSCQKYGYTYEWCYLKKGSWGYCSNGLVDTNPIITKSLLYCKVNEKCSSKNYDFNWCNTELSWDYCDENQDVWSRFTLKRCSADGKAIYSSTFLKHELTNLNLMNSVCKSYKFNFKGIKIAPSRCYFNLNRIIGEFEITFDKAIDRLSNLKCYEFEKLEDPCGDYDMKNNVRVKRAKNCIDQPANYYSIFVLISIIRQLINRNGERRSSEPVASVVPRAIYNFPGFEGHYVLNSFTSNGQFSFRLLRSDAQEDINQENQGVLYRRKPSEGNGLNGLFPANVFATYTLYEHIISGSLRTQYISSSVDFGRTMDLAIQQALRAFRRERMRENFNGARGYSRYFVQIDLNGLNYYDLTNPNVLRQNCLSPSGYNDLEVINFARRWSEIIISGRINKDNIVRTFEVYAVSDSEYILNVIE